MSESIFWDAQTLKKRLDENPYIRMIDVRSPAEYESVHIADSYNIPMNVLPEHGPRLRESVRDPIVFVCLSGKRAERVMDTATADPETKALLDAGIMHIYVLEGGIKAWESSGGKVLRGHQRWSTERQIRCIAGSIVLVSILASVFFPWTKWIAGFVGAGLVFAALSNFCAMELIVAKMPWNRSTRTDVSNVVNKLIADAKHATH